MNHSIPQKQVLHGKKQIKSSLSLIRTGAKLILSQVKSNRNVLDEKNDYIYILFSGGTASFEEEVEDEEDEEKSSKATKTHTYTYESEVWRGRLNQLWFDKDPLNAGK